MNTFEITRNVHWIGVRHPELRLFDDLMPTRLGTTYNSYLVTAEKVAVIDTVKGIFAEQFMANLAERVNPKDIDYIVVNHTEPDHSGTLDTLLAAAPQARLLASRPAQLYLRNLLNRNIECSSIEEVGQVDLGGKSLQFIPAPFLHWPDTIFTWLPEDRILFSCDAFGAHYCADVMYDDEVAEDLDADFRVYYDTLMRPYRDKVLASTERVRDLDLAMICPSHGPIRRRNPREQVQRYLEWTTLPQRSRPLIAIIYVSAHGKTGRMAEALAEGIRHLNVEAKLIHATEVDDAAVRDALETADGLLFGTPTIVRDVPPPMWHVLSLLSTVKVRARAAAAFGSYGWSGEATGFVEQRLKDMRVPVHGERLRVKFTPNEADLAECRRFGEAFATSVAAG